MAGVGDYSFAMEIMSQKSALAGLPCALISDKELEWSLSTICEKKGFAVNCNFFAHKSPIDDDDKMNNWRDVIHSRFNRDFNVDFQTSTKPQQRREPFSQSKLAIIKKYKPQVVSFHFGLPDDALLNEMKDDWNPFIVSSATTVGEAIWLEARGVDAIIAQGAEAGGHRGMFLTNDLTTQLGTFALLPQIVQSVTVPVIAAGGICDGKTVRAAKALGASAVQAGTVFLTCPEMKTSQLHRQAIRACKDQTRSTALTNIFTGRPARSITNRAMKELGPMSTLAPEFPNAAGLWAPLRLVAESRGLDDFSPLWCGDNASNCREVPANVVVDELRNAWFDVAKM